MVSAGVDSLTRMMLPKAAGEHFDAPYRFPTLLLRPENF